MSSILTIAEIKAKYDAQWVLLEDPQTDESLEVQSGRVIANRKSRDEVYRHAAAIRPKRFAILFTGKTPHDAAIIL